jgi:beta-glucosidase
MAGVSHYIEFLKALKAENIKPAVTMWHWDTPNDLEVNYGGLLNSELFPIFFEEYSKVLYQYFGEYVPLWITLNEPFTVFQNGYQSGGVHAPGRCSDRKLCEFGDDATEPYQVAYTEVLSHAHAVRAFRDAKSQTIYPMHPDAKIGITLNADWGEPLFNSNDNYQAAFRRNEW